MAIPSSNGRGRPRRSSTEAKRRLAQLEREQFEDALFRQIQRAGLELPERQARLVPDRALRFDFAWPARLLACEVDGGLHSGGRHVRGAGAERDAEKYSLAAIEGYRVLRVSTAMVTDGRALGFVRRALAWRGVTNGEGLVATVEEQGPAPAWFEVVGRNGVRLRTNFYEDSPDGARFVAVLVDGEQVEWQAVESWADDPELTAAGLAALWRAAARGATGWSDDYGMELVFATATGALRADPDGAHVRVVEHDGTTADGGSTYWTSEEIAEDPVLCMGAILAAAGGGRAGRAVGS